MKRFTLLALVVLSLPVLASDETFHDQEEKGVWESLFGRVKAEDQIVSDEEVQTELVRLLKAREEYLADAEERTIEREKKALPLSVQAASKEIRERAHQTIENNAHENTLKEMRDARPVLADRARQNLQHRDAVHHNLNVSRLRVVTAGTLALGGAALTAYSFDKLTSAEKLVEHVNNDPQVAKALEKFSALRQKLAETDSQGISRMTKLKSISSEVSQRIAAFEKNVNNFINPSLVKRFEEATRKLEQALVADQTMKGSSAEFHHSVRGATQEFEAARKAIEIAKNRSLGKLRRELHVAETYRRELEAAKTNLARAREWSLYKAQKLYPALRSSIKVAGVVSGVLIMGTAAGLAYTWAAEETAPTLNARLSRSFLRSDSHYSRLRQFQDRRAWLFGRPTAAR